MLGSVGERASTVVMDFQHEGSWHPRCSCGVAAVAGLKCRGGPGCVSPRRVHHSAVAAIGMKPFAWWVIARTAGDWSPGGAARATPTASDPRVMPGRR